MAVFDNRLMFISSGNLTKKNANAAMFPTAGLKIRGTAVRGMAVRISIPSYPGTTVKMLPEVHVSNNDSTYKILTSYPGGALSYAKGTAIEVILPLVTKRRYAKLYFKIVAAGATTGTSFGAVKAGIVEGLGFDWDRAAITSN